MQLVTLAVVFAGSMVPVQAQAGTLIHQFDYDFSGGTTSGPELSPWITATFIDSYGGPNTGAG